MPTPRASVAITPPEDLYGQNSEPLLPPEAGPTLQAITALDGAIAMASESFGPLTKDADNTFHKSSYLSLGALLEAVRLPLQAQQVSITSSVCLVAGGFVVTTTLTHSGGGWRSSSFPVGDPMNPQKVAAAATYGLRVNLQQLLALVGTDDDGNAASGSAAQQPQPWEVPVSQGIQPAPYGQPPAAQFQAPQGQPYSNVLPQWQSPPAAAPQPGHPAPYV